MLNSSLKYCLYCIEFCLCFTSQNLLSNFEKIIQAFTVKIIHTMPNEKTLAAWYKVKDMKKANECFPVIKSAAEWKFLPCIWFSNAKAREEGGVMDVIQANQPLPSNQGQTV